MNSVITFDSSKSINSNEKNYTLSCQGRAGIWIVVDSTQKTLEFDFAPETVAEFYHLTLASTKSDRQSLNINFEKKIVDVFFGGMGQSITGDTVFILLEDGTVEYIPIVHMFNHLQDTTPASYGKVNGISGVAKFILASTSDGVTTLAMKNDGTFYDLERVLENTENY